jgi:putative FmdB family regulatory protein
MPTYTYRCGNCGAQFDRQQSFQDPALVECPECGHLTLRKLFSPVGIVFKGPGFYSTDHGSRSRSNGSSKAEAKESKKEEVGKGKPSEPTSNGEGTMPKKKAVSED